MKRSVKPNITQALLKELLDYDPETGAFTWRISPTSNRVRAGQVAGTLNLHGYVAIQIGGRLYSGHRLAWLYVTGAWPSRQIDHKNHNRADNRWENLREATQSQNAANMKLSRRNTSGAKGVTWHKDAGKWMAQIMVNGRSHNLGCFDDISDAAAAYAAAAKKTFGEFAHPAAKP